MERDPTKTNHPGRCQHDANCGNMQVEVHPDGGHYSNENCFDVRDEDEEGTITKLPPGTLG